MDEVKLSPEFESMMGRIYAARMGKRFELEAEYFDTLSKINERQDAHTLVCGNLMKMSMDDQLKILKLALDIANICVELQAKYEFEAEKTEDF